MAGVDYSQFKGKPFQVISKLGVRYTGIFDHISQEDQTICLAQVFNHGTEDRPTARKLAGSSTTLGWVRFHTESIESLALVENYIPPGEEAPVDPILASVSDTAPGTSQAAASGSRDQPARRASHDLPPKPSQNAISAATALDRVQESLHDLSVNDASGSRPRQPRNNYRQPPQAPEVPDAEFDFTKGTQAFEKEREGRRVTSPQTGPDEIGEPEAEPHPSAFANSGASRAIPVNGGQDANGAGGPKTSTVYKKSSFFDGLSGESSRISRNEERHRNYDTFGEAGGSDQPGAFGGRGRGGYGGGRGGYGGRGGFGGHQQGHAGQSQGYGRQQGFGGDGYGRGRGRGYGNRGGFQGGQGYEAQ